MDRLYEVEHGREGGSSTASSTSTTTTTAAHVTQVNPDLMNDDVNASFRARLQELRSSSTSPQKQHSNSSSNNSSSNDKNLSVGRQLGLRSGRNSQESRVSQSMPPIRSSSSSSSSRGGIGGNGSEYEAKMSELLGAGAMAEERKLLTAAEQVG
jgi:hypothetical protein